MTELRHLQLVILGIMRDVDELCRRNNIEYYLLGGSAIGAVRHQGFIPWDDDLDIVMSPSNYSKFIHVCKEQLNKEKYYFQEGLKDWPLNFSKVRLRNTELVEREGCPYQDEKGIYLDVFKLENAPSGLISQSKQYFFAKLFLCYQLSVRSFKNASIKKRLMMVIATPLHIKWIRDWIQQQVEKYGENSDYYGSFYFRTRFRTAFTLKTVFGKPLLLPFEDMMLPVPEHYHEYLTQMFGDYMTPPPQKEQVGMHGISVNFGKY